MRRTEFSPGLELEMLVLARHGYRCAVCDAPIEGPRGVTWALHHRRFRDGRPDQDSPANLLPVCGASNVDRCHGRIHGSKTEAMGSGWAVTRHGHVDPATVAVLVEHGSRWTYLTHGGDMSDNPPGGER